jgi:phosphohistidine swiveling domain-containing protein
METSCAFDLTDASLPRTIGSKAEKLRFLIDRGFRTPMTVVCTWDAYSRYSESASRLMEAVKSELSKKLDLNQRYAVRSSANVEDSLDHSFAGQFKTVLDVQGADGLARAVGDVWASGHSPGVEAYLNRMGKDPQDLKMAVMIQEMVPPVVSGVSFSRNPVTGADEIVVEAVEGSGETLAQEGITPARWIHRWGTWVQEPEHSPIPTELIQKVVSQTRSIAAAYGCPVDLEWVYDGYEVFWVQLREITALSTVNVYSNRAAREVLPGIIKPLVWSVNVPLVNGAWVKLLTEIIGPNDIDPRTLSRSFYYRAYFNVGAIGAIFEKLGLPRDTLGRMGGTAGGEARKRAFRPTWRTLSHVPRLLRFIAGKRRFDRRIEAFLPAMEATVRSFPTDEAAGLSEQVLLDRIDELYRLNQEIAYYNIVTPNLMRLHAARLRRRLQRAGVDFESFDVTGGMEELHRFDPNVHLRRLNDLYRRLGEDPQARIRESTHEAFLELLGIDPLQQGVARFLDQFGHLSDSGNDFSYAPWRENPDVVLGMIVSYPRSEGSQKLHFEDLDLSAFRRFRLARLNRTARKFRLYREAVGSLYTYGYGLFRIYFLALGGHFVRRGLLASNAEIFYLDLGEIEAVVREGAPGTGYADKVAARKREIEMIRDAVLPEVIFGDEPPPVKRLTEHGRVLSGTPTSRGYYRGPARVVRGIEDFKSVSGGDVLVIPYSDVGWTPLFSKAGAVIAESGGILSHSSIVAREYGIPAVVSVSQACQQLQDGTVVTVDGYTGTISIEEEVAAEPPHEARGRQEG